MREHKRRRRTRLTEQLIRGVNPSPVVGMREMLEKREKPGKNKTVYKTL